MLGAIYWLKQRFSLFTFISFSHSGDMVAVQNWKKSKNHLELGQQPLYLEEKQWLLYVLCTQNIWHRLTFLQAKKENGLDETSVK